MSELKDSKKWLTDMDDKTELGLAQWIIHVNNRLAQQDQHIIKLTNQVNENTMLIQHLRIQLDALCGAGINNKVH